MTHASEDISQHIRATLLVRPEVANWPAVRALVESVRPVGPYSLLNYPGLASRAVGASAADALPAAIALYCLHASIHLVDDMLDHDDSGLHRRIGEGETANIALALQAVGLSTLNSQPLEPVRKQALLDQLATAASATAYGQALDVAGVEDEAGYWRVAEQKTPPLFVSALAAGALLGGSEPAAAEAIGSLGDDIGIMIQISDDLTDAMSVPAQPDWLRPDANLALLYARTAEHDDRARFRDLCARVVEHPADLDEAQRLLAKSGAIAYCCYRLAGVQRRAFARLADLELLDPEPLRALLRHHVAPLEALLRRANVPVPEGLLPT